MSSTSGPQIRGKGKRAAIRNAFKRTSGFLLRKKEGLFIADSYGRQVQLTSNMTSPPAQGAEVLLPPVRTRTSAMGVTVQNTGKTLATEISSESTDDKSVALACARWEVRQRHFDQEQQQLARQKLFPDKPEPKIQVDAEVPVHHGHDNDSFLPQRSQSIKAAAENHHSSRAPPLLTATLREQQSTHYCSHERTLDQWRKTHGDCISLAHYEKVKAENEQLLAKVATLRESNEALASEVQSAGQKLQLYSGHKNLQSLAHNASREHTDHSLRERYLASDNARLLAKNKVMEDSLEEAKLRHIRDKAELAKWKKGCRELRDMYRACMVQIRQFQKIQRLSSLRKRNSQNSGRTTPKETPRHSEDSGYRSAELKPTESPTGGHQSTPELDLENSALPGEAYVLSMVQEENRELKKQLYDEREHMFHVLKTSDQEIQAIRLQLRCANNASAKTNRVLQDTINEKDSAEQQVKDLHEHVAYLKTVTPEKVNAEALALLGTVVKPLSYLVEKQQELASNEDDSLLPLQIAEDELQVSQQKRNSVQRALECIHNANGLNSMIKWQLTTTIESLFKDLGNVIDFANVNKRFVKYMETAWNGDLAQHLRPTTILHEELEAVKIAQRTDRGEALALREEREMLHENYNSLTAHALDCAIRYESLLSKRKAEEELRVTVNKTVPGLYTVIGLMAKQVSHLLAKLERAASKGVSDDAVAEIDVLQRHILYLSKQVEILADLRDESCAGRILAETQQALVKGESLHDQLFKLKKKVKHLQEDKKDLTDKLESTQDQFAHVYAEKTDLEKLLDRSYSRYRPLEHFVEDFAQTASGESISAQKVIDRLLKLIKEQQDKFVTACAKGDQVHGIERRLAFVNSAYNDLMKDFDSLTRLPNEERDTAYAVNNRMAWHLEHDCGFPFEQISTLVKEATADAAAEREKTRQALLEEYPAANGLEPYDKIIARAALAGPFGQERGEDEHFYRRYAVRLLDE